MIKFDYGTQLSPSPIMLSIGTLIKPTLREISNITFDKFNYYEALIKMSPEIFYTKIKGEDGEKYWNSLSIEEQNNLNLYDIVLKDSKLINQFVEIFNFFFKEKVIFKENYFILLNNSIENTDVISEKDIHGVISENVFLQVLNCIQQICCINDKEDKDIENIKFKNALAKKLYEKMQKAEKEKKEKSKGNVDFTLPNIISSVSSKHPSINLTNVWDLTVFQLLDCFNRTQINSVFDIDCTRISVWGDEKKTFNAALWYKNEYDKNNC